EHCEAVGDDAKDVGDLLSIRIDRHMDASLEDAWTRIGVSVSPTALQSRRPINSAATSTVCGTSFTVSSQSDGSCVRLHAGTLPLDLPQFAALLWLRASIDPGLLLR